MTKEHDTWRPAPRSAGRKTRNAEGRDPREVRLARPRQGETGPAEGVIAGRNAVTEALQSGRSLNKIYLRAGVQAALPKSRRWRRNGASPSKRPGRKSWTSWPAGSGTRG